MFLPWILSKNILKKNVRWAKFCPLKKLKKSKNRKYRYLSVEIFFSGTRLLSGGFFYKDHFPKRILDNSQNCSCSIPGKWTFLIRNPAIPPVPFPRSKKMVISSTQLKLFCLTPSQRANLKMASQHPSCSVSIKKGAVNKHSDWRWKIWRARRALSKFREHNATSFFAHDFTAWWGIPRRYRKS